MRRILVLTMLVVGGCLMGCKSFNAKTTDDQKATLEMWSKFARDNGVVFVGQMDYRGRGGFYYEGLWGADLGVGMHGTFLYLPGMQNQPVVTNMELPK